MSLLSRVLTKSRCQVQSIISKDPSGYLGFRISPLRLKQDVRGFKTKLEIQKKDIQKKEIKKGSVQESSHTRPPLLRYFIYTGVMVPGTFCGAFIWQYENLRNLHEKFHKIIGTRRQKEVGYRDYLNTVWNSYTEGQRMVLGVLGINCAVFACWRFPQMFRVLTRYFQCRPGNPASSMTLSAFSHFNLWHICANMYVLWSFTPVALNIYGKEQFLAVYLSAATISSLTSIIGKNIAGVLAPSLGASGAILAILASVCYQMPDTRVAIAFVDQLIPHSFSAKSALIGILVFDTLGILLRWRIFDHAAHLGGTLFGIVYMRYGKDLTWEKLRRKFLKHWHDIRKSS